MSAESGADLHQLKARLDLLDEHVCLDRTGGKAEVPLERAENVVPERRLLRGLDFRQIQHQRRSHFAKRPMVVDDEQGGVDDRGREADAGKPYVAIVEVQAARAEDRRGEPQLLLPVVNQRMAEKS